MSNNNIICAVLVISYNHGMYLERALDSIIEQKTKYKFRIDIFDDASKDNTKDIIKDYEKKYPDIVKGHIAEKNFGAQGNFWRALNSVDTKYLIILEGDDYWCDDRKLELQINALEKNPNCSFCGHNTYLVSLDERIREYKEGSVCCTQKFLKSKNIFTYDDFKNVSDGGYIPYVSSRLIRTEVLDLDNVKYKESVLFDFTQFYYLLLKGDYYYIDMPMTVYQRTGTGVCSGVNPMEFLNTFISNAIDFNKETNNVIADKIYSDCMLQIGFRLKLYKENYIKKALFEQVISKDAEACRIVNNLNTGILVKEDLFEKDAYYYLLSAGLGYTMIMCSIKKTLENELGAKIYFLVQAKHEFILKLYNIEDYIVVDIDDIDLEMLSSRYPNPEKGKIYVAHPFAHKEAIQYYIPMHKMYSTKKYIPWVLEFLGVDTETEIKYPQSLPQLSEFSKKKIEKLGDLSKIVLFLPEANTVSHISERIWEKKAKEMKALGYKAISCPQNKIYTVKGTSFVELNADEIVYVGMKCKKVYAIRNGYCDLLATKGLDLHIYYPSHNSHYIYSVNKPGLDYVVDEEIVLEPSKIGNLLEKSDNPIPLLFGLIRIPNFVYSFYHRNRRFFKNKSIIKRLIKWT